MSHSSFPFSLWEVQSKVLGSSEFLWIILQVWIINRYISMPSHLSLTRILALSVIFFVLIYQVFSHAFWIIKKPVWHCLPWEFITKIFPFGQLALTVLEYEKPACNEGSYFYCFPPEPAPFCQPKHFYPFHSALSIFCFSNGITCIFSILQAQPEGAAGLSCCIWPKETGCHHLTEQKDSESTFQMWLPTPSRVPLNHSPQALLTCFNSHLPGAKLRSSSIIPQTLIMSCFWCPLMGAIPLCYPTSLLNLLSGSPELMFSD